MHLLALAFLLAYALPFCSLLLSTGLHVLEASGDDPYFGAPADYSLKMRRVALSLYRFYTIGVLPARLYLAASSGSNFFCILSSPAFRITDSPEYYGYIFFANWVTFLSWLVVLFGGSFSWRYLLGPGVSARRRVTTLWVIGVFIEVICATAALWWVTTGEPCGDLVRALVFAIPLALLLQGALLLAYAWWSRRRSGVTPKWLKALSVSTVVLGIGIVVLWIVIWPVPLKLN
jgi:hypothetical protein